MHLVQIGCHTGDDSAFSFIKDKENEIEQSLIIDALPSSVDICEKLYKENIKKENFEKINFLRRAIVADENLQEVDFFVTENEHQDDGQIGYTAFSSTDVNHLKSHGVKNIKKISIPSITLDKLFNDHSLSRIDRLFLDAEGLDAQILLSLDFEKFEIPFICYESSHTDGTFNIGEKGHRLFNKFKNNNYKVYTFFHSSSNEGYDHDQYDWNCWALKGGQQEYDDMVEYSGHKSKIESGFSKIVEI